MNFLLVALGGAVGAMARYAISLIPLKTEFPFLTLITNVIGAILDSWKEFFNTSTNWKDLDKGITYQDYLAILDKEHVKKIMQMPVHFLLKSGNGFFVAKDGAALALSENLREVVGDPMFAEHMRDAIEYRAMDYYQRRYQEKNDA